MKLVRLVFQQYRWPLAMVLLLSKPNNPAAGGGGH